MDQTGADNLTDRQKECLRLAARPMTSKEIARELGLSPRTVDWHLDRAVLVLGASGRFDAARRLVQSEDSPPRSMPSEPPYNLLGPSGPLAGPLEPAILERSERQRSQLDIRVSEMSETQAVYRAGPQHRIRRVPLPFATREEPENELSGMERMAWVLVLGVVELVAFGACLGGLTALNHLL
ncbi:helix-turn-helix domain-containing protein [Sphingomonas montanisoli]|uniref:Helix-turn-helix transcriptional regulator n=1 Tax=Sphingomonas montanisoli TaxID=2606412 RepID=A0A5D9C349_9SPHN|nr:helix-turn-helix transcriptional regulator [Sphingomonas montanisoli]TZG25956.1 helix-turn-helix transcriptional regulator [Sphingomonas montanisoli]